MIEDMVLIILKRKKLKKLKNQISKHNKATDGQARFKATKSTLIKNLKSKDSIMVIGYRSNSFKLLKATNFDSDNINCGKKGSLEQRIEDCSIYQNSSLNSFLRVIKNQHKELFLDTKKQIFYGVNLSNNDDFNSITNTRFRSATSIDFAQIPAPLKHKIKYTTSTCLNNSPAFRAKIKRRYSDDQIVIVFNQGIAKFYFFNQDGEKLINELNLNGTPHVEIANTNMLINNRFNNIQAVANGQVNLNDALFRGLEMGYIFLFPIPVVAHAIYSLAYAPAFVMDLFGKNQAGLKKLRRFLNGKDQKANNRTFNAIIKAIEVIRF